MRSRPYVVPVTVAYIKSDASNILLTTWCDHRSTLLVRQRFLSQGMRFPCNAKLAPKFMNEKMATMKTVMAVLVLGGVLSLQPASVVLAGPLDGATFRMQDRGYGGAKGGYGGPDRRQFREARSAQPLPPSPREPARGQLTQEERHQLHRDLDKANRELYGGKPRRSVPAD